MAPLLDSDETLMAVSAWNDNGQAAHVKASCGFDLLLLLGVEESSVLVLGGGGSCSCFMRSVDRFGGSSLRCWPEIGLLQHPPEPLFTPHPALLHHD